MNKPSDYEWLYGSKYVKRETIFEPPIWADPPSEPERWKIDRKSFWLGNAAGLIGALLALAVLL